MAETNTKADDVDAIGTTWRITPSISPNGTAVMLYVENTGASSGSARLFLDADQAEAIAGELDEAVAWCRKRDIA